jgi:hypothetical protein
MKVSILSRLRRKKMDREAKQRFNWRGFVSVATGLSFLVMSITGIVLFITPKGRVAHWVEWRMLGLTKDQWGGLHIWFSLIFMVMAAFHIYLNWQPLLNYFRDRVRRTYALRREWLFSLIICGIVFAGTLADVAPFSSLLVWNELIKNSWEVPGQQAPIPHAEAMTLAEIADKVKDIDAETMVTNLRAGGIEVESAHVIVGQLAEENNLSPRKVYAIAVGQSFSGRAGGGYRAHHGLGQLTLQQYCDRIELDVNETIEKLRNKGIQARPDMLLRNIARGAGMHASDIRDILEQ